MLILGLDSSAIAGSCALCDIGEDNCRIIAGSFINTRQTHSQTLLPMVENMLKCAEINIKQVEKLAITSGPGSFTGVRIGVSTVKGLGFALNIPCVGVSTLHALAYNLLGIDCIACAVMDARCNQFYNALFRIKGKSVERLTEDRAIFSEDLKKELNIYENERIILVGDGAELASRALNKAQECESSQMNNVQLELAPLGLRLQKAESVCLASKEYQAVSAKELLPHYLRLPQAERERLAKINKA
ncbi:MAG: tRNA (adenosine(37)-N6)-threonylcarbamoyltransferase complex dimerization subunit type 1 TsaB [Firmicutes bacterium]|nr:tRNA (adenosine(37)-N6)-threonylcarbamoyltransferase complex dimerization subunit type 1 TsaB [[Eubacterium] siraeum]MCM1488078.1 tRNA (adenosine(37)-N6)-threonylcarbamoyltransferase complex dimerization subunit type 1 TsaB [Bacillota bacterium]